MISFGGLNNGKFLGPNQGAYSWFNKVPICIKCEFQVYRLFTAMFLHTGFSHIV